MGPTSPTSGANAADNDIYVIDSPPAYVSPTTLVPREAFHPVQQPNSASPLVPPNHEDLFKKHGVVDDQKKFLNDDSGSSEGSFVQQDHRQTTVNPSELHGVDRENYLNRLWEKFSHRSAKGRISTDAALDLFSDMGIECTAQSLYQCMKKKFDKLEEEEEEKGHHDDDDDDDIVRPMTPNTLLPSSVLSGSMDSADEKSAKQQKSEGEMGLSSAAFAGISRNWDYNQVQDLFDEASRLELARFRDLDVGRDDQSREVTVGPLAYFWYNYIVCDCEPHEKHAQEQDQAQEQLQQQQLKEKKKLYVLDPKYRINVKPKTQLLVATVSLMILIGFLTIVIISSRWYDHQFSVEKATVRNLGETVAKFASNFEYFYMHERMSGLTDETEIFSTLLEKNYELDVTAAERNLEMRAFLADLSDDYSQTRHDTMIDVAEQLREAGALFDFEKLKEAQGKLTARMETEVQLHSEPDEEACLNTASLTSNVGQSFFSSSSSQGSNVELRNVFLPPHACFSYDSGATHSEINNYQMDHFLDQLNEADASGHTVFRVVKDAETQQLTFGNPNFRERCLDNQRRYQCDEFFQQLEKGSEHGVVTGLDNQLMLYSAIPSSSAHDDGALIVASESYHGFLAEMEQHAIDLITLLNDKLDRAGEYALARLDRETDVLNTDVVAFKYQSECFSEKCTSLSTYTKSVREAYDLKNTAQGLAPDYRPEPNIVASRFVNQLGMVVSVYHSLRDVRQRGLAELGEVVDELNAQLKMDSTGAEVELFREVQQPPMPTYDPRIPCPKGTDCEYNQDGTLYYRFDCRDCERFITSANETKIEFLNSPRMILHRDEMPNEYLDTLINKNERFGMIEQDTKGDQVLAATIYLRNYSAGMIVKTHLGDIEDSLISAIFNTGLLSGATLLGGTVLLVICSSLALKLLDSQWEAAKNKLLENQIRFGELVGEIVPPSVSKRMMKQKNSFAADTQLTCMVFSDICGFCDFVRCMNAKQIVRLTSYCFLLMETVTKHTDMSRLTSIGDTFVCYAIMGEGRRYGNKNDESADDDDDDGGEGNSRKGSKKVLHPAIRGAKYAAILSQLFSCHLYGHYPERAQFFREAFKDRAEARKPLRLPPIRIGGHCGFAISGLIDTGLTPRFDIFGITASVAAKMCTTCPPSQVRVSSPMHDYIRAEDVVKKVIGFGEPSKTVIRGQGSIVSFDFTSCKVEVSDAILEHTGVCRAATMHAFEVHSRRHKGSVSSRSSATTGSSHSSSHSSAIKELT